MYNFKWCKYLGSIAFCLGETAIEHYIYLLSNHGYDCFPVHGLGC